MAREQCEARRLDRALARLPRVSIVYKGPPRLTPDDDAIQVLSTVLSSGRSSRLYQSLVRRQQ